MKRSQMLLLISLLLIALTGIVGSLFWEALRTGVISPVGFLAKLSPTLVIACILFALSRRAKQNEPI